jgi:hypothetical protein
MGLVILAAAWALDHGSLLNRMGHLTNTVLPLLVKDPKVRASIVRLARKGQGSVGADGENQKGSGALRER